MLTETAGKMQLNWSQVPGSDGYRILRGLSPGRLEPIGFVAKETQYIDDKFVNENSYFYSVRTFKNGIESEDSNVVMRTGAPNAPVLYGIRKNEGIKLNWTSSQEACSFTLLRSTKEYGDFSALSENSIINEYEDTSAEADTTYYYKVRAWDSQGRASSLSNTLKLEPFKQEEKKFNPQGDDDGDGINNEDAALKGLYTISKGSANDNKQINIKTSTETSKDKIQNKVPMSKENPSVPKKVTRTVQNKERNINVEVHGDDNLSKVDLKVETSSDKYLQNIKGAVGEAVEVTADGIDINSAVISMPYDRKKLGKTPEDKLKIYWVDRENRELVPLDNIEVDKKNQIVRGTTSHFSTFMLCGDVEVNLSRVDMVFAIDQSDGMNVADKGAHRLDLPEKFIQNMINLNLNITSTEDALRIGLIEFSDYALVKQSPTQYPEPLTEKLASMNHTTGATNLADAIWIAQNQFVYDVNTPDYSRRRIITLISDGKDTLGNNDALILKILERLKNNNKNITINTVSLGSDANNSLLQKIAESTGGSYYYLDITSADTVQDIDNKVEVIYDKIVKQVTLDKLAAPPESYTAGLAKILPLKQERGFDNEEAVKQYTAAHANLLTGNFAEQVTDIKLNSTGIGLFLERTYNSDDGGNKNGLLGNGWTLNFETSIKPLQHYGRVLASALNVRSDPALGNNIIAIAPRGIIVKITGDAVSGDGISWYPIEMDDGSTAYIASDYIESINKGVEVTFGSGTKISFDEVSDDGITVVYRSPFGNYDTLKKTNNIYYLTRKDQTQYAYDNDGKLVYVMDRYLNGIYVTYSSTNTSIIDKITDNVGRTLTFTYVNNKVWKITDPLNRVVEYLYDANGNLTGVINSDGKKTTYTYTEEYDPTTNDFMCSRIHEIIDANGHAQVRNEYDSHGRLVKQYDANNNVKYHIYKDVFKDDNGTVIPGYSQLERYYINENGSESRVVYNPVTQKIITETDLYGKNVQHRHYIDLAGTGISWTDITNLSDSGTDYQNYQAAVSTGNKASKEEITDKKNYTTVYEYDSYHNLVKTTDAKQNSIIMEYDALNNITRKVDDKGGETLYIYKQEVINNLTIEYLDTVKDPLGNTTTYEYYQPGIGIVFRGLKKKTIDNLVDKNGILVTGFRTTEYKYEDSYNNCTEVIDALGSHSYEQYDVAGRLKQVTDARNNTKEFNYDSMDRITEEIDVLQNKTIYVYDKAGNKRFVTDKNGNTTEYIYDNKNQLITVIDPMNDRVEYNYDATGKKIHEVNKEGGVTRYDYDSLGRMLRVTNPLDASTVYEYDDNNNIVKVTDANLKITTFEYDELNRKTKEINNTAGGPKTTTYTYDANNNLVTETDTYGKVTQNTYDALNRLTQTINGYGWGPGIEVTTISEYDVITTPEGEKRQKVSVTNALNQTTSKETDALGHVKKETDAKQNSTLYTYDAVGNLLSKTDALGHANTFEYDALNRVKKAFDATGVNFTEYEYDAVGNNTAKTDRRSNRTEFHYNKLNHLAETVDPYNNKTTYSYDENGNLRTITDAKGQITGYIYNKINLLTSEIDADGYIKYYEYDALGNKTAETRRNNQYIKTRYIYDDLYRLIKVIDPEGTETVYSYDLIGNLKTKTDGELRKTDYSYDNLYRVTSMTDGEGMVEKYNEYDKLRNIKSKTDRNGITTVFEYDELNRIKKETAGTQTREYNYDAVGNLTAAIDETGTTGYVYDILNQLKSKTLPGNKTIAYDYDAEGNKAEVKDPENNLTTYQYDKMNRMEKVITSDGISTYTYDPNGNRETQTLPNGTATSYGYNARNLLTSLENRVSVTEATYYQYGYDANGLQTFKVEPKGRTEFAYDDLGRVKKVTEPDGRITQYTYDRAGNRKTQSVNGIGLDADITYNYNRQNRLTQTGEVRNGQTINTIYEHDKNGNQIKVTENVTNISTYIYDNFNQLKTVNTADGSTTLNTYNAFGQRVQKTVAGSVYGEGTVNYYYDSTQVLLEMGSDGKKSRNVLGVNLIGRDDGAGILYYLYNGHADVVKLVNTIGNTINEYDYDIFGNPLLINEQKANPYRYAGYYYDSETQYYYLNARYYDPETARFISEDTYTGEYNDPLSLNLYTYCVNNPIRYVDPSGHVYYGADDDNSSTQATYANFQDAVTQTSSTVGYNPDQYSHQAQIIQQKLQAAGYDIGACGADGYFGDDTLKALNDFKDTYLSDGNVGDWRGRAGQTTLEFLDKVIAEKQSAAINAQIAANQVSTTKSTNDVSNSTSQGTGSNTSVKDIVIDVLVGAEIKSLQVANNYNTNKINKDAIDLCLSNIDIYVKSSVVTNQNAYDFGGNVIKAAELTVTIGQAIKDLISLPKLITKDTLQVAGTGKSITNIEVGTNIVKSVTEGTSKTVELPSTSFTTSKLQHEFKHAGDFGVTGNWNKATGEAYQKAIQSHIDTATDVYKSTYRGQDVNVYINKSTGVAAYTDLSGNYVGGWKFSPDQMNFHLTNGTKIK